MEFLQQLSGSYMDSLLQEIYVKKRDRDNPGNQHSVKFCSHSKLS